MSETLVEQARKRGEIRRKIPRGEPDRISDLLEAMANQIEQQAKEEEENDKTEGSNELIDTLLRFYGVATLSDLVFAQAGHVERLQKQLPPRRDTEIGKLREG